MSERFLDRVLNFMGIQEDEQAAMSDEDERPRRGGGRGRLVSFPSKDPMEREAGSIPPPAFSHGMSDASKWRVMILEPQSFDHVQTICDHLKERRPVIVSVEGLDKELSKRVIDFVSGTTYAIDGQIQRVSDGIFVFAPSNVVLESDLERRWGDDD